MDLIGNISIDLIVTLILMQGILKIDKIEKKIDKSKLSGIYMLFVLIFMFLFMFSLSLIENTYLKSILEMDILTHLSSISMNLSIFICYYLIKEVCLIESQIEKKKNVLFSSKKELSEIENWKEKIEDELESLYLLNKNKKLGIKIKNNIIENRAINISNIFMVILLLIPPLSIVIFFSLMMIESFIQKESYLKIGTAYNMNAMVIYFLIIWIYVISSAVFSKSKIILSRGIVINSRFNKIVKEFNLKISDVGIRGIYFRNLYLGISIYIFNSISGEEIPICKVYDKIEAGELRDSLKTLILLFKNN